MAHLIKHTKEETHSPGFLSRVFKPGRYGIALNLGRNEVFLGFTVTPIVVFPVRRLPRVAKKGNIPTVVEYNL